MQVFARMDFVAHVDALGVGIVEDRLPAPGQFVEGGLDETSRPLRPGIEIGPCQRPGKGRMGIDAEIVGRLERILDLLHGPFLPRFGIAAHFRCGKAVERLVIGRVNGDQLALKMGGKLGDLDAVLARNACEFVAIVLGFGRLFQVDQLSGPGRHLHTEIARVRRPFGDRIPGIERCGIAGKLAEKDRRPLDRLHEFSSQSLPATFQPRLQEMQNRYNGDDGGGENLPGKTRADACFWWMPPIRTASPGSSSSWRCRR